MTRRSKPRAAAVAAALAGTACAHHAHPGPAKAKLVIPADYEAASLTYPSGTPPSEFAVCTPGLVVVPTGGGLYLAGWDHWLRKPEPAKAPITSVDCDEADHVFFIRDNKLMLLGNNRIVPLAPLPPGDLHLTATIDSAVWIWGKTANGLSVVLRYDRDVGMQQLGSMPDKITAAAVVGMNGLVTTVGNKILLWQRGVDPKVTTVLPGEADGIAVQPDGNLWVSIGGGILSVDANGKGSVFAAGLHGPMRARASTLYVLLAENAQVIRLRPQGTKDDGATPPGNP